MADGTATELGASRIQGAFNRARDEKRAALMPYLMGGFPDQDTATAVADAYAESGADLIELGVPFSDPLADGPTIHAADTAALEAGATLESVLETCSAVSSHVPVVLMVYANMVIRDPQRFSALLDEAGATGAIVPDLPIEEAHDVRNALAYRGIALVPLIAPTTPEGRRAEILRSTLGFTFFYLVSTVGTTGEREGLPKELFELITETRRDARFPLAVGFGISTSEQAAEVGQIADGVIIGSRLVREVADAPDREAAVAGVSEFLRETREGLSR